MRLICKVGAAKFSSSPQGKPNQHTYPTPEEFRAFEMKGLSLINLREYVDILQRFGFFETMLPDGARLPRSAVSVKVKGGTARVNDARS